MAQIDTAPVKKVPTARIDLQEEKKSSEMTKSEPADRTAAMLACLTGLQQRLGQSAEGKKQHQDSVKTLHKVIENIAVNPGEDKYTNLPKGNKGVQEKILAHREAVSFLERAGFDFSDATQAKAHKPDHGVMQ